MWLLLLAHAIVANVIVCPASINLLLDAFIVDVPLPPGFVGNPFSANDLKVTGTWTSDAGAAVTLIGVAVQNYTSTLVNGNQVDQPAGDLHMEIRVRAVAPGTHTLVVTGVMSASNELYFNASCDVMVNVVPLPEGVGFLSVAPNKRHFATSDGADWFGVGENLCWVTPAQGGIFTTLNYLANLTANGGNYIRIWLTDAWSGYFLETALGRYSLPNAFHVDQLLAACETAGVRVLMCIESYNQFCTAAAAAGQWAQCVYNTDNGGPVATPAAFFTDGAAKSYFQQRLAYIVGRFAASTAVFAWEFFNEVDVTDAFNETAQVAWLTEMAAFLRSIDPFRHPITTSLCCLDSPAINSIPALDFTVTHTYGTHNANDMADNAQFFNYQYFSEYTKPTYIAEFGESGAQNSGLTDPTGIGLKNAMWASVMSGAAVASATWWWDSWVAPYNLYRLFAPVRTFTARVPWGRMAWTLQRNVSTPVCDDAPPSPQYTCAQQASWGKCNQSFMVGFCCQSCFNCSVACVGPPVPSALFVAPDVRLLAAVGTPLNGNSQAPTTATMAVLWLQNANNTYTKQPLTPLVPTTGLSFALPGSFAANVSYTVQWFDTTHGVFLTPTTPATCISNVPNSKASDVECLELNVENVPTFVTDLAAFVSSVPN